METWKSPRRVEEEITLYLQERFEHHYQRMETGEITREEMVKAMQEETSYAELEKPELF